jgi:hypothetical protein
MAESKARIYIGNERNGVYQIMINGELRASEDLMADPSGKIDVAGLGRILGEELSRLGIGECVLVNGKRFDPRRKVYTDITQFGPIEERTVAETIRFKGMSVRIR